MKTVWSNIILFLLISSVNTFAVENDVNSLVAENTKFSFDLYDKLKNSNTGNLFFSPYSVSTALAMTYAGARGETQKQMATALHFTLPNQRLYSAFGILQKQLVQENKSVGYQLLLANALWCQKGEPFLKEFLDLNQNYYGATLNQLDFVKETEKSQQIINSWVEKKTEGKIKDLIPSGGITPDTELVLTNAVYFKGDWKTQFKKEKTKETDFNVSDNYKTKTFMMYQKGDFKYYEDPNLQLIELPYKGKMSMLALLPRDVNGLNKIENEFTAKYLNVVSSKMNIKEVELYFPKFKMTWGTFSLKKNLIDLGMTDAFAEGKADFSGINGRNNLWVSDIFHKAFIEVNEEGTEAAASTSAEIAGSIEFPVIFRADHPFIFLIKDNTSGSILFIGRVINPAE